MAHIDNEHVNGTKIFEGFDGTSIGGLLRQ